MSKANVTRKLNALTRAKQEHAVFLAGPVAAEARGTVERLTPEVERLDKDYHHACSLAEARRNEVIAASGVTLDGKWSEGGKDKLTPEFIKGVAVAFGGDPALAERSRWDDYWTQIATNVLHNLLARDPENRRVRGYQERTSSALYGARSVLRRAVATLALEAQKVEKAQRDYDGAVAEETLPKAAPEKAKTTAEEKAEAAERKAVRAKWDAFKAGKLTITWRKP